MKPNQEYIHLLKSQEAIVFNIVANSTHNRTTIGDDTLLTIQSNQTITITGTGSARILLVGGGGGGRGGTTTPNGNNGGGGGEVIDDYYTVSPGTYNVTVGQGASGNGTSTNINTITETAGGGGSAGTSGSGYGGVSEASEVDTYGYTMYRSTGGGGAGGAAINHGPGTGVVSDITGSNVMYGYGGSGGIRSATASYTLPSEGYAGWIERSTETIYNAVANEYIGGGGSGGAKSSSKTANNSDGNDGIVLIRFRQI